MSTEATAKKTCVKCGACCKALIIDEVFEVDIMREPRLKGFVTEFKDEPGQFMLKTPCHFLKNSQCSIYPTRPDICVGHEPGTSWVCPVNPDNQRQTENK